AEIAVVDGERVEGSRALVLRVAAVGRAKTRVALRTVRIPERETHGLRLVEASQHIEECVFAGQRLHACASEKPAPAMAIDAAKPRVVPFAHTRCSVGRGERCGWTPIEALADPAVEGLLRGEMAGVAKVVVVLETIRGKPADRDRH